MKKVVVFLWHGRYNMLLKEYESLNKHMNLSLYSAKLMDEKLQDIKRLKKEMRQADVVIIGRVAGDKICEDIERSANAVCSNTVILDENELKNRALIGREASLYYKYGGKDNLCNMIRYIVKELFNEDIPYEKPVLVPWEAVYDLDNLKVYNSSEEYFRIHPKGNRGTIGIISSRYGWINENTKVEQEIIGLVKQKGYNVLPVFLHSEVDESKGTKGITGGVKRFFTDENGQSIVDGIIKLTGFGFESINGESVLKQLDCPVAKPIMSMYYNEREWENSNGASLDVPWNVAIPEVDGCILPMMISTVKREFGVETNEPVNERCETFVDRFLKWVSLRAKPNKDKKPVIMYNGANSSLNTANAVCRILMDLKAEGYNVGDLKNITDAITFSEKQREIGVVSVEEVKEHFEKKGIEVNGQGRDEVSIRGMKFGNVTLLQQPFYQEIDPVPSLEDLCLYYYIDKKLCADGVINLGLKTNLHIYRGKSVGLTESCYTDICIGNRPMIFLCHFSEACDGILAKRRAMGVLISHKSSLLSDREIKSLIHCLNGGYVTPCSVGQDRGGNNIHGFSFDEIPTKKAWKKGKKLAEIYMDKFWREQHTFLEVYEDTIAGTDIVDTGGEQIAFIMALMGVEPIWRSNGKLKTLRAYKTKWKRPSVKLKVSLGVCNHFAPCVEILCNAIGVAFKRELHRNGDILEINTNCCNIGNKQ